MRLQRKLQFEERKQAYQRRVILFLSLFFFPHFPIVIICFIGCSCVLFDWVDDKCNNGEPKFLTLRIDYNLGSQKL